MNEHDKRMTVAVKLTPAPVQNEYELSQRFSNFFCSRHSIPFCKQSA